MLCYLQYSYCGTSSAGAWRKWEMWYFGWKKFWHSNIVFTFIVEILGRRTGDYTWICCIHTLAFVHGWTWSTYLLVKRFRVGNEGAEISTTSCQFSNRKMKMKNKVNSDMMWHQWLREWVRENESIRIEQSILTQGLINGKLLHTLKSR